MNLIKKKFFFYKNVVSLNVNILFSFKCCIINNLIIYLWTCNKIMFDWKAALSVWNDGCYTEKIYEHYEQLCIYGN